MSIILTRIVHGKYAMIICQNITQYQPFILKVIKFIIKKDGRAILIQHYSIFYTITATWLSYSSLGSSKRLIFHGIFKFNFCNNLSFFTIHLMKSTGYKNSESSETQVVVPLHFTKPFKLSKQESTYIQF